MLLLEKASHYFSKKLPFALFVKPNQVQLNGVFQNTDELVEFSGQKGFVFSGFYNTKDVVLPFDSCEVIQENWSYEKQYQERIYFSDSEGVEFKNLVQKGINAIVENQFEKVVLSRKIEIPNDTINSIESFKNLVNTYSTAFRYLFYHPQIGLWMGQPQSSWLKLRMGNFIPWH